jgi:hypothetical protein
MVSRIADLSLAAPLGKEAISSFSGPLPPFISTN